MSEQHSCNGGGSRMRGDSSCQLNATIERNGRWYCKRHDPETARERHDKAYARQQARIAAAPESPVAEARRLRAELADERALNAALAAACESALRWHQSDQWRNAVKRDMRDDWKAQRDLLVTALARAKQEAK